MKGLAPVQRVARRRIQRATPSNSSLATTLQLRQAALEELWEDAADAVIVHQRSQRPQRLLTAAEVERELGL